MIVEVGVDLKVPPTGGARGRRTRQQLRPDPHPEPHLTLDPPIGVIFHFDFDTNSFYSRLLQRYPNPDSGPLRMLITVILRDILTVSQYRFLGTLIV